MPKCSIGNGGAGERPSRAGGTLRAFAESGEWDLLFLADASAPLHDPAQLRELANWLRAQGEGTKADDADELAEAIAFKYEVV